MDNLAGSVQCGTDGVAGDFLSNDRNFFHMFSGGAWGLVRVHGTAQKDLKPLSEAISLSTPKKK